MVALTVAFDVIADQSPGQIGFSAAVVAIVGSAVVAFGARSRTVYDPPNLLLRGGLPRAQRRAVRRDIRRGEPSLDPTLRGVEVTDARVMARTYLWLSLGVLAATGFEGWVAVGDPIVNGGTRLLAVGLVIVTIAFAVWCASGWYCARRFLRPLGSATGEVRPKRLDTASFTP